MDIVTVSYQKGRYEVNYHAKNEILVGVVEIDGSKDFDVFDVCRVVRDIMYEYDKQLKNSKK